MANRTAKGPPTPPGHKWCRECEAIKPHAEFYPHKLTKDGLNTYCKPCDVAKAKAYTEAHGGSAARWANNKAKMAAQHKAYVARKVAEDPQWRARRMREHYAKSPSSRAKRDAHARKWAKENPEARRMISLLCAHKRKAQKMATDDGTVTAQSVAALMESFGHCCAYCLQPGKMTLDHVVPLSKGGPHSIHNLAPACGSCNSSKYNRGVLVMLGWFAREVVP
jgi:5-methylcytosine-specific restriction endonuclease McrA